MDPNTGTRDDIDNNPTMRTRRLPPWIASPAIEEGFETESSVLQQETADECLPLLQALTSSFNDVGLPPIVREKHIRFLRRSLGRLPGAFASLDASKPWMLYWALNGLALLGEDMGKFKHSLMDTLRPIQNTKGGFGGGQGQYSHLATTYASVLGIAVVGGEETYDLLDREAIWHWLGRLKQPGGQFEICEGGEQDVRAAYCAMMLVTLLNLPVELPSTSPARLSGLKFFSDGLAAWISRCQTYEGGLGCAPGAEAHGAYVFCGLACLCILGSPATMMSRYLDLPALVAWLSARQHAPEGGLGGRTNKLVDGCYSHWIGGCWPLVEAAVAGAYSSHEHSDLPTSSAQLWSREGLICYVLCCCQAENGGLRDKPSKNADAYHTNYNLAGLSSAQNDWAYKTPSNYNPSSLPAPFNWHVNHTSPMDDSTGSKLEGTQDNKQLFNEVDRVPPVHPVFVVPAGAAEIMHEYFASRPLKTS